MSTVSKPTASNKYATVTGRIHCYDDLPRLANPDSVFGRFIMAATRSIDIRSYSKLFSLNLTWFKAFRDFSNTYQNAAGNDERFYVREVLRMSNVDLACWIFLGMYDDVSVQMLTEYGTTIRQLYLRDKRKSFRVINGGLSIS